MQADEARFLLRFLLPQLESEQRVTSKIFSAVPPDQEDYKPAPKSKSALQLAWHIAVCEIWLLDGIIQRRFGEFSPKPPTVKTCHGVAQWYEENFARRAPLLQALSGDELATPVEFHDLRNDAAVAYLNIAIRHSVHHRGQLSTYLRVVGARVPAIYVESADEPYPPTDGSPAGRPPAF